MVKQKIDKNLDRFDDDYEEQEYEDEQQQEQQPKKKKLIKDIFNQIITQELPAEKQKEPIFANFKKPLKELKKKKKQIQKEKQQKQLKLIDDHVGHKIPDTTKDKQFERSLKIGCVKGVVKVFNAIINYQKTNSDQQ